MSDSLVTTFSCASWSSTVDTNVAWRFLVVIVQECVMKVESTMLRCSLVPCSVVCECLITWKVDNGLWDYWTQQKKVSLLLANWTSVPLPHSFDVTHCADCAGRYSYMCLYRNNRSFSGASDPRWANIRCDIWEGESFGFLALVFIALGQCLPCIHGLWIFPPYFRTRTS
jgi:hypothetical protein